MLTMSTTYENYVGNKVQFKFLDSGIIHVVFASNSAEAIQEWVTVAVTMLDDESFDPLVHNRFLLDFCTEKRLPSLRNITLEKERIFTHPRITEHQYAAVMLDQSNRIFSLFWRFIRATQGRRRYQVFNCGEYEQALNWLREQP